MYENMTVFDSCGRPNLKETNKTIQTRPHKLKIVKYKNLKSPDLKNFYHQRKSNYYFKDKKCLSLKIPHGVDIQEIYKVFHKTIQKINVSRMTSIITVFDSSNVKTKILSLAILQYGNMDMY